MVMDRATLGHNVRPLLAQGYVSLSVGRDRRSREVVLTERGRKILQKARPLWRRAQAVFERDMGVEEAAQLRAQLDRVSTREFVYA
jgi:DNA-binding MarR family transcriptional regulator